MSQSQDGAGTPQQLSRSRADSGSRSSGIGRSTPRGSEAGSQSTSKGPISTGRSTGSRGTPLRGDIGQSIGLVRDDASTPGRWSQRSSSQAGAASSSDAPAGATIWGTTVEVQKARTAFLDFVRNYRGDEGAHGGGGDDDDDDDDDDEGSRRRRRAESSADGRQGAPFFATVLREMPQTQEFAVNVDCYALNRHNTECKVLYDNLVKYPQEVIPIMDSVMQEELQRLVDAREFGGGEDLPEEEAYPTVQVRPYNLHEISQMRSLEPTAIDTLVSMQGMVIRTSNIIPDLRTAQFQCQQCPHTMEVDLDHGRIDEPSHCPQCHTQGSMGIVHNLSLFKDKQLVRLQETPEAIPQGETPHSISLYCHEELVDTCLPGDRVTIVGVYRAAQHRVNPRMSTLRSVFRTYVDVLHVSKTKSGSLVAEAPEALTGEYRPTVRETNDAQKQAEQIAERCAEVATRPALYDDLAASLAPSIWSLTDVKKGLLLQLFGGTHKDITNGGRYRGDINVLLCGDPGTSKSQLLQYVQRIAPRGIYTSGKGSSAVGLTAYVTKDPDTGEPMLESGALVLSDRGVCCIDEFDKMSDATRTILHEVMEQQTVSIAKAGIIATLNARTSVLASANPVESRYNPRLSVVENIKLPPTLLSRFDLIYLILDKADAHADEQLARHLVSLYQDPNERGATRPAAAPIDRVQLAEYISYARIHINPIISEEAASGLVDKYMEMRNGGHVAGAGRKVITATPRQLESLIRLSEAHARMRLSGHVTAEDVEEAARLMRTAMQQSATDPTTGTIDMDLINTGRTALMRGSIDHLVTGLREMVDVQRLQSGPGTRLTLGLIIKKFARITDVPVEEADLIQAVRQLGEEGVVQWEPSTKTVTIRQ